MAKSRSHPPSQQSPPRKRRASRSKTGASTAISELPTHLITDILLRLSDIKSIITCKRVCTIWRDLILQPYFVKSHLSRGYPSLSLLLHRPSESPNPSHFGILELHDPARLRRRNATMKFTSEIFYVPAGENRNRIIGACNGLVCMHSGTEENIVVWNPILQGQLPFIVPKPKPPELKSATCDKVRIGFGYSSLSDKYKVLRTYKKRDSNNQRNINIGFEICTLGIDDTWRTIGGHNGQLSAHSACDKNYVFLNGALHWISFDDNLKWFLCYFNVEKEEFGNVPLPCEIKGPIIYLGIVDGTFLYISDSPCQNSINVWVMQDYEHMQSWMLKLVVSNCAMNYGRVQPLKTMEDGTVLMILNNKILASYDSKTRAKEKIRYHGVRFWTQCISYTPSFVSPPLML